MADEPPAVIEAAGYTVRRELGRGGMATVYLAHDRKHDREVALKVLRPELAAALGSERFLREIRLAARLQHPHILPVFDSGESGGQLWYTMPFVSGESLADRLSREPQLPLDEALRITSEVAGALDYAHAHGVIHRDVKPANVMLSSGHALLSDLGIAAALNAETGAAPLTATGMIVGTPAYMSPEQASGDRIDGRSDLYSLACVLYEMLAGEPPFIGRTPQAVVARRMTQPPSSIRILRPQVAPEVDVAITRALALAPADRYPTGQALIGALTQARPAVHSRRRSRIAMAATAGALAVVVAAAWLAARRPVVTAPRVDSSAGTPTVAVLPFRNLGDSSRTYFAEGLVDEIGSRLSDLSGLHTIARPSLVRYGADQTDLAAIGRELGARFILTGSVRYDSSATGPARVRVAPRLVDATNGESIWSDEYDGDLTSVFAMQSSVAEGVARALNLALRPAELAVVTRTPTSDTLAYDYYLRGMTYANSPLSAPTRPRDFDRAADFFSRATDRDSTFALAWAMLSRTHSAIYANSYDRTSGRLSRAKTAADAALRIAPDLPEAHMALAQYEALAGESDAAFREYEQVERLQPSNAGVQARLGQLRKQRGQWAAAIVNLEAAVRLDPHSPATTDRLSALGWALYYARRYAEAGRVAQRSLDLAPDDMNAHALAAAVQAVGYGDTAMARRITWEGASGGSVEQLANLSDVGLFVLARSPGAAAMVERLTPAPFGSDTAYYYIWKASFFQSLGDAKRQRAYADSAQGRYERFLTAQPDEAYDHRLLGLAYAFLGRRNAALIEASRAVDLLPVSKDAVIGADNVLNLARVAALVGDTSAVVATVRQLLGMTSWVSPTYFRIDPIWAPYRALPELRAALDDAGG